MLYVGANSPEQVDSHVVMDTDCDAQVLDRCTFSTHMSFDAYIRIEYLILNAVDRYLAIVGNLIKQPFVSRINLGWSRCYICNVEMIKKRSCLKENG